MEKGAIEPGAELDHYCSTPQQQSQLCFHNNDHSKHDLFEMKHHSHDEQSSDDENLHSSAGDQQQVEVAAAPRKLKLPYRRNSSSFPSGTLLHRHNWPQAPTISLAAHASDLHTGGPNPSQQQKPLATPTASTDDQKIISINPVLEEKVIPKKKITTLISSGINANPKRVCKFCDREFPSGRALGGHMRVHGALATESLLTDVEPEKRQLDAFITRSSSPIANSRKDRLAELKCMISGSQLLNSRRSLIRRRINSEESMVRGFDDEGKSVVRGINEEQLAMKFDDEGKSVVRGINEEQLARRDIPVAEEEQLVKRREKLVTAKEQLVKRGIPAEEERLVMREKRLESSSTLVKGRSLEMSFCQDQEFFSDDVDDDESFGLHSSELMALSNGVELPVADNNGMVSSASECISDKGIPLYKLRQNLKPNRRLWTDQEDFSIHQAGLLANQAIDNHQSSASNHSIARRLSSPPLRVGLAERAPCSECGKVFWSWKALFGHMRCHPEREWRGIQRPEVSSSEPEKQVRAGKKLNSLVEHSIAGNALEMELELDAQNREESKQIEAASTISAPANEENLTMKEEREAKEPQRSRKEEEKDFNEVEEFPMVMTKKETKRSAKPAKLRGLTHDLTPSAWPTRKRSRRIKDLQLTTITSEPALTSETGTSSELRDKPKFMVEDQEDLDMANCLVFLSNAGNQMQDMEKHFMETTQESAFRKHGSPTAPEYSKQPDGEVAALHNNGNDDDANDGDDNDDEEEENHAVLAPRPNGDGVKYECSTCNRCFNSHQALGGHRASHRKTKGCFARTNYVVEEVHESGENSITEDPELDKWQIMRHAVGAPPLHHQRQEKVPTMILPSITERSPANNKKKRLKGHECSICHRNFPSGQALGGHKRCHWTGEKIADTVSVATSSNNNNNNMASLQEQAEWGGGRNNTGEAKKVKEDGIDLNLPAPLDDENEIDYNNVGFSSTEATAPMVCGRLVDAAEGEQIVGSLMDCPGSRRSSLNGLSRDWIAEDLLGVDGLSRRGSWVQANRELEARCRFDGRTAAGVWSQQWTSAAAAWKDS